MTSLQSIVSCAIKHGITLCTINGNIHHWTETCRNAAGERPTTEEFRAEYEAQQLAAKQSESLKPAPIVEDE